MKTPTDDSQYYAAASKADIGAKLLDRVDRYDKHPLVGQVNSKLFQAWQYYFG